MRISIKQGNIQNLINKQFPISITWRFTNITLSNPEVVLIDGSERLGIKLTTQIKAKRWNYYHTVYVDGTIDYQTHLGELFLKNVEVDFLLKSTCAKKATWPINKIVVVLIKKYAQHTPIYHFNQDDFMHKLAKSRITGLKIENCRLVFEFKFF